MNIFFKTKTTGAFDRNTLIAFSVDGAEPKIVEFKESEPLALLQFATQTVEMAAKSSSLVFRSRPNTLRNPFEKGWIKGWIADGFQTKPTEHRKEWEAFYKLYSERSVTIEVDGLAPDFEELLKRTIRDHERGGPELGPAPGDPFENPWQKPADPDELFDRAVKKSR